jgi:antitoxin component of RelBE/YafQ-DinJ toxin-antitoxin module
MGANEETGREPDFVKEDEIVDAQMFRAQRGSRVRRTVGNVRAGSAVEALEDRQLLSGGMGPMGVGIPGGFSSRAAEMSAFQGGRRDGFFGGGSLGLGGGMNNPILLLTAPLIEGGSGQTTPPSPAVFSNSGVQTAMQTLQTDLKTDIPSGAKPTHASVGALEDDLDAIRKGTLTGTAASTKIQADQAAILTSMGLTQAQVTQIQSDQQALETAITTASTSTGTSGAASGTTSSTTASGSASGPSSAVQSAMQTLQTDLKTDTPSGATLSHEAVGTVEDDLDAIRKGTLTGTGAVTQVQTDAAAVLTSMGLTSAQVSQIQADQQALAAAMAADPNQPTTTSSSSSATQSTLQSVSEYLVGLPGVSSFGMGGIAIRGFGGGGMGGGGFGGGGQRGGFMSWR